MSNTPTVLFVDGKRAEDCTKQELIDALKEAHNEIRFWQERAAFNASATVAMLKERLG